MFKPFKKGGVLHERSFSTGNTCLIKVMTIQCLLTLMKVKNVLIVLVVTMATKWDIKAFLLKGSL